MTAAVTDAYADAATYRAVIGKSDTGDDTAIELDLLAISRYVDQLCGQFFTKDASQVARVYRTRAYYGSMLTSMPLGWAEAENPWRWGPYTRLLQVDNMAAAPTSIVIDENDDGVFDDTPLTSSDYELWPQNAAQGPETNPWTAIYIPPHSTRSGFAPGKQVQITTQWGWPAVPGAVVRATCHLTGILRLESPRATSQVNEIGTVLGVSKAGQSIIADLLKQYRRTASVI